VKWYAFEKGAKFPDLEEWIDVKGVDEHHHRLIIGAEKNPDWAYLLVDATDHPTYEIVCWCWGHEGKQELYWEVHREDGGGYFIRRDNPMMKSPQELMDIIRERQRASRAGLVGHDKKHGHFIHYCHCGRDASFGHDVHLSKGQFGVWYCMEHNPS
jgi:hypothetical protein